MNAGCGRSSPVFRTPPTRLRVGAPSLSSTAWTGIQRISISTPTGARSCRAGFGGVCRRLGSSLRLVVPRQQDLASLQGRIRWAFRRSFSSAASRYSVQAPTDSRRGRLGQGRSDLHHQCSVQAKAGCAMNTVTATGSVRPSIHPTELRERSGRWRSPSSRIPNSSHEPT